MPRKTLLLVLLSLALIEAGVLLTGLFGHHKSTPATASATGPAPATATRTIGPQNDALPYTVGATPTLYIEPQAGFDWLHTLVRNTKRTLDMTMYELVDPSFSADLAAACGRGVKVRVILDQNLERARNTPAFDQLTAAGPNCTIAWANPQFQATHQKSLILDGNTAVVMTANLTSRYYATSRDFALIDTDTADINGIRTVLSQDFGSTTDFSFDPPAGHNLIWSPTTAEDDLVSLINGAKATLLVENEELGAAPIVSALAAACRRGVKLSLAMTDTSPVYHPNFKTLEAAGCGVHIGPNDANSLYIHAKTILADLGTANAIGYVGSINFSNASMNKNRELGLYVHDPNVLRQLGSTVQADFNQFPPFP